MTELRKEPAELEGLVDAVANGLRVDSAFVEKDFWATEVLRAASVALTGHSAVPIFKGGTSLSKVFGLLDRFSEDIDVLVDFEESFSKAKRNQALKGAAEAVRQHLALDDEKCIVVNSRTGVARSVRFEYPSTKDSAALSQGILLEMGSRGGTTPSNIYHVTSLIAEYAQSKLGAKESEWDEFAPYSVRVLGAERTLLEKLALISSKNAAYTEGTVDSFAAHGRHVYDIYKLLESASVIQELEALGSSGVADLVEDIDTRSLAAGWEPSNRPAGGFSTIDAFTAGTAANAALGQAFERATDLIYGARPSFDTCMQTIRSHHGLI